MAGIRSNYCTSENQFVNAVNSWLLLITSDRINAQLLLGCRLTLSEEWVHAKTLAKLGSLEKPAMTSSGVNGVQQGEFRPVVQETALLHTEGHVPAWVSM